MKNEEGRALRGLFCSNASLPSPRRRTTLVQAMVRLRIGTAVRRYAFLRFVRSSYTRRASSLHTSENSSTNQGVVVWQLLESWWKDFC